MPEQPLSTLLATMPRGLENRASAELSGILRELGDPKPRITKSGFDGVVLVDTTVPSLEFVARMRKIVEGEPWRIRYLQRIVPIQRIVQCSLEEIGRAAGELAGAIPEGHSFRVTVENRGIQRLATTDIIEAVAGPLKRKVDLRHPDWIILVEVLLEGCGLSVVRPEQILSIVKVKRSI